MKALATISHNGQIGDRWMSSACLSESSVFGLVLVVYITLVAPFFVYKPIFSFFFAPSPSRRIVAALGSCMVSEVYSVHWHVSQFGRGGFRGLRDTVFEITTQPGKTSANVGAGREVLKLGCGGSFKWRLGSGVLK